MSYVYRATGSALDSIECSPSAEYDRYCPGRDSVPSGPEDREELFSSREKAMNCECETFSYSMLLVALNWIVEIMRTRICLRSRRV
jgi:hypothetical protein